MKLRSLLLLFTLVCPNLMAQQPTIPAAENLVVEGIPPLPADLIREVKSYTEARSALFVDWHPTKKELLISTRFANSNQLHTVHMPGGDRQQITFFNEPITTASFDPKNGSYLLFLRDTGGNEFSQIYRYDLTSKQTSLLTDGKKSQNGGMQWNNKKDQIVYASTKRNGQDRDIYLLDPLNPASNKKVVENTGGGWSVED